MASKDSDPSEGPSLELPSLGSLRRRRKHKLAAAEPAEETTETMETSGETTNERASIPEPPPEPQPEPEPEPTEPIQTGSDTPPPTDEGTPAKREGQPLSLPALPGMVAASITGVVSGLLMVLGINLAMRGCEALRGTSSCGGSGLFLLLAIIVVLVALGSWLLRAWGRSDASTISFLGVGLTAVIAMLVLSEVMLSTWMIVVVPIVALVCFLVAYWVSDSLIGEDA